MENRISCRRNSPTTDWLGESITVTETPEGPIFVIGGVERTYKTPSQMWVWWHLPRIGSVTQLLDVYDGKWAETTAVLVRTTSSEAFVVGYEVGKGSPSRAIRIARVSPGVKPAWDKIYAHAIKDEFAGDITYEENQAASAILIANEAGILVAGSTTRYPSSSPTVYLLEVNPEDGKKRWDQVIAFPNSMSKATSLVTAVQNGYAVAGIIQRNPKVTNRYYYDAFSTSDALVIRLDSSGKVVWARRCGGRKDEIATAIASLPDGGFIVGGTSESTDKPIGWVLRLDAEGFVVWERLIPSAGEIRGFVVSRDHVWALGSNLSAWKLTPKSFAEKPGKSISWNWDGEQAYTKPLRVNPSAVFAPPAAFPNSPPKADALTCLDPLDPAADINVGDFSTEADAVRPLIRDRRLQLKLNK